MLEAEAIACPMATRFRGLGMRGSRKSRRDFGSHNESLDSSFKSSEEG